MNELNAAIAYFEDTVRESNEIISECSPALQAELTEQKQHLAVALDVMRRAQPDNEPLTLNQLREMDGERVWSEVGSYWMRVNVKGHDVWLTDVSGQQINALGWIKHAKHMGNLYRRPPERGEG